MFIELDDDDLEGHYTSIRDCPIARRVKKIFPGKHVNVGGFTIDIGMDVNLRLSVPNSIHKGCDAHDIQKMRDKIIPRQVEIVGFELENI